MKTGRWRVRKISGEVEAFDGAKIKDAIFLAAQEAGGSDEKLSGKLAAATVAYLLTQYGNRGEISTRDIGDGVERVLIEQRHVQTAKTYILNRDRKREEYEAKIRLGVKDDWGMSLNSLVVMKHKYLHQRQERDLETPGEALARVAKALAKPEKREQRKFWEEQFFQLMLKRRMLPAGRTLANAGTVNNQLANCFVMPFPDDIEGIFEVVKESSILKKNGGGVGFSFSKVRPKGDLVMTTSGGAAGPVALMGILDHASQIFLQAGGRRSGNMITLAVNHPDIFEFIACKETGNTLPNVNYSIEMTDQFMRAVEADRDFALVNPKNGEVVQRVSAVSIMEHAARMAWKRGDPGVIFIDRINEANPTPKVGRLETVNLCGEQPLLPYEACNLGSINLVAHLRPTRGKQSTIGDYRFDWTKLTETVAVAVRMLDNVIEVGTYPLAKIDQVVKQNRKIGLGIMGWADTLVRLGIAYNSAEARALAGKVMGRIQKTAEATSERLAKERGSFANFEGSSWEGRGYKRMRNATLTTIAPTGSLSMVAGVSGGIEPLFALAYSRKAMGNLELPEVNADLVLALKRANGVFSNQLLAEIGRQGSIQNLTQIPIEIRRVFVTAMDIGPSDHVLMQAAWQKYTDNAVSKTINLPARATVAEVMAVFLQAWRQKCKGITVYRDQSRVGQVLTVGKKTGGKREKGRVCPECGGRLAMVEGCETCNQCGFGKCSV